MKTLLLILFPVMLYGQTDSSYIIFHDYDGDTVWTFYGSSSGGKLGTVDAGYFTSIIDSSDIAFARADIFRQLNEAEEKIITVELLLQYAEECWNDSTDSGLRETIYTGRGSGIMIQRQTYIHRKPTFESFLEWLKKK